MADTFLPPDLAAEQARIRRREAMAQAMMQQALAPIEQQTAGGFVVPVSPFQGLGKAAQAYFAGKSLEDADKSAAGLGEKYRKGVADELLRVQGIKAGTPDVHSGEAGTDDEMFRPGTPGDPRRAVMEAMTSPYGAVREMGKLDYAQLVKPPIRTDLGGRVKVEHPDGRVTYEDKTAMPVAPRQATPITPGTTRTVLDKQEKVTQEYQADGTWKEIGRGPAFAKTVAPVVNNVQPAPVTPVTIQDPDNPNGTIVIDGRTKQVLGKGPKLTESGKANLKQASTMQGLGADLQRAEDLLLGQVRDSEGNVTKGVLPTGSGLGSVYDSVAGFFGASPDGAAEATALKTVAARLVSRVPRFEGPQSNLDVALYQQAAADAGNEKLPRDQRVKAIQTMRQIYAGYEDGTKGRLIQDQLGVGQGTPATAAAPGRASTGKVRKYNPATGRIE